MCLKQNQDSRKGPGLANVFDLPPPKVGDEVVLLIEVGSCPAHPDRACPIARYYNGRRILLPFEEHDRVKPGENWKLKITEARETCIKAVPVEQISNGNCAKRRFSPEQAGWYQKGILMARQVIERKSKMDIRRKSSLEKAIDGLRARLAECERVKAMLDVEVENDEYSLQIIETELKDCEKYLVSDEIKSDESNSEAGPTLI